MYPAPAHNQQQGYPNQNPYPSVVPAPPGGYNHQGENYHAPQQHGGDSRGHHEMQHLLAENNPAAQRMLMSQRRAGCLQECLGCEAKTQFDYYDARNEKVLESVAESDCCERTCCPGCYSFETEIKSKRSGEGIITVKHPFVCQSASCKCCCYQSVEVFSGRDKLGDVTEECWYCVPRFTVKDSRGGALYKLHQPTCCGGCCVNFCATGCCSCRVPFHLFPANQAETDGDAAPIGVIMKSEKDLLSALVSDADNFHVDFPKNITAQQRALLIGATLLINFNFFEGESTDADNYGATA